jgi:hypothetical protein
LPYQAARLNKFYQVFHGKNLYKGEKSCSYLVRYVTHDHNEEFGFIEYFVRVKNSNQILELIQHIDFETNHFCDQLSPLDIILDDKYYQALNSGLLSYFYRVELQVFKFHLISCIFLNFLQIISFQFIYLSDLGRT